MLIKRDEVEWELKNYLRIGQTKHYEFAIWLNKPLADWDTFDTWEQERTRHMVKNLEQGDILFDIGAEVGWLSVAYGTVVHPSNMVLIEPTPEFWPNIQAIWQRNFSTPPLATYHGLFSNRTTSKEVLPMHHWPEAAEGDLIDKLAYTYIHDNPTGQREIRLDDYVKQSGIVPSALTLDVEGAELLVLQGASQTLAHRKPKIWVSIHPDLAEKNYGVKAGEVKVYLERLGYIAHHISTDHEEHWFFEARGE